MSSSTGRRYADTQGTRLERGHPALVESLSPTLIGELEALVPRVVLWEQAKAYARTRTP